MSCAMDDKEDRMELSFFEYLNLEIVSETVQPDVSGASNGEMNGYKDLRPTDGSWYYALEINFRTCESDDTPLPAIEKSHADRLIAPPSSSSTPSSGMLPPYWFGNVLVFRGI